MQWGKYSGGTAWDSNPMKCSFAISYSSTNSYVVMVENEASAWDWNHYVTYSSTTYFDAYNRQTKDFRWFSCGY